MSYTAEPDTRSDAEWVSDLFEFEVCDECLGDAEDHLVLNDYPFSGSRFALCLSAPIVDDVEAVRSYLETYGPKVVHRS